MTLRLPEEIENLSEEELRAHARENGEKAHAIRELYRSAIARLTYRQTGAIGLEKICRKDWFRVRCVRVSQGKYR